jgi:CRP-like cAMP-binding protein
MKAGTTLFNAAARPSMWLLASGEVTLEEAGAAAVTARGGDMIGSLFSISGQEAGRTATIVQDGIALRIDRDDLFEVLGERPDLLRQMFAGMIHLSKLSDISAMSGLSGLTWKKVPV